MADWWEDGRDRMMQRITELEKRLARMEIGVKTPMRDIGFRFLRLTNTQILGLFMGRKVIGLPKDVKIVSVAQSMLHEGAVIKLSSYDWEPPSAWEDTPYLNFDVHSLGAILIR